MAVRLQSWPPLGQVTTLKYASLNFTVSLESESNVDSWEVSLWHSVDGAAWVDTDLAPTKDHEAPIRLSRPSSSTISASFATSITFKSSIHFTIKYRTVGSSEWKWIRDEVGLGDGHVLLIATEIPSRLSDLIPDLHSEWRVHSCLSESPGTFVWSLETNVPPAVDDKSGLKDVKVGTPWGSFLRWFALVRLWTPWLAPRQGSGDFSLDRNAVMCSFLSQQGLHLVVLALSGIDDVLTALRSEQGFLFAQARNDSLSDGKCTLLVSVGSEFGHAVASVMFQARRYIMQGTETVQDVSVPEIKPEWMENWYDGLGFCTWNALGQRLTDEKLYDALEQLSQNNIRISSLIIDDNWQSIEYKGDGQLQHRWLDFEAEPKAFPKGLKVTVRHVREKYPWIKHVAVWHAILGYWGGISPTGEIAKRYQTIETNVDDASNPGFPLKGRLTVVAKEDISRLYNDFYEFLSNAGIDGVKTDAQYILDSWTSASTRRELTKTYLDAWALASLRHFGSKVISCMSQFPQSLFHTQMPTARPPILVRNSDDFFPAVPASHPWHVWSNAHNAIFTEYLNVLPDWDMFQTINEYSDFHAAARCVSGGPIYITDAPGQYNMDLIRQMTGITPRGNTVIFRPSNIGKVIQPYVGYEDGLLLQMGSYHGASTTGTSIMAIFNVSKRPLTELIPLASFAGTQQKEMYVIRAHRTGHVSRVASPGTPASLLAVTLEVRGYEIFWASPLTTLRGMRQDKDVLIANFGLVGKMTGCAAIVSNSISRLENGRILVDTRLKALGTLGLFISELPQLSIEQDFIAMIQGQPIPVETVTKSGDDRHVLEIDLERAWKEMGLSAGWSNEVEVKIYFSS